MNVEAALLRDFPADNIILYRAFLKDDLIEVFKDPEIEFKILLIVFKIFRGLAPSYLSFLITSKPVSKYNLRSSSDSTLLSFPNIKVKATLGERAFVFAAPKLWNALPRFIRETNSIDSFKRQLKTYLFKKAFCTT